MRYEVDRGQYGLIAYYNIRHAKPLSMWEDSGYTSSGAASDCLQAIRISTLLTAVQWDSFPYTGIAHASKAINFSLNVEDWS